MLCPHGTGLATVLLSVLSHDEAKRKHLCILLDALQRIEVYGGQRYTGETCQQIATLALTRFEWKVRSYVATPMPPCVEEQWVCELAVPELGLVRVEYTLTCEGETHVPVIASIFLSEWYLPRLARHALYGHVTPYFQQAWANGVIKVWL